VDVSLRFNYENGRPWRRPKQLIRLHTTPQWLIEWRKSFEGCKIEAGRFMPSHEERLEQAELDEGKRIRKPSQKMIESDMPSRKERQQRKAEQRKEKTLQSHPGRQDTLTNLEEHQRLVDQHHVLMLKLRFLQLQHRLALLQAQKKNANADWPACIEAQSTQEMVEPCVPAICSKLICESRSLLVLGTIANGLASSILEGSVESPHVAVIIGTKSHGLLQNGERDRRLSLCSSTDKLRCARGNGGLTT